jgi:hypothetical protein
MARWFLVGSGALMFAYGLFGLIGIWLVPALGNSRLYGPGMLSGRMDPTRFNRTLMSFWVLFIGGYFALSASGYRTLSYAFFLAFLVCAITAMVIRHRHSR